MSGATPSRPVRLALSFAPDRGAWPKHPVVLVGQALRLYLRGWDVSGAVLDGEDLADVVITVARPGGPLLATDLGDGHGIGAWSAGVANDIPGLWRAEARCTVPSAAVAEITWRVQARGITAAAPPFTGFALLTDEGALLQTQDGDLLVAA